MSEYRLEKIKLEGAFHDIIARSTDDLVIVTYKGVEQSLASALASILSDLTNLPTDTSIEAKINEAIDEILGGASGAFDTLKEVETYISEHEDVVTALNNAIGNKVDKVTGKGLSTNDFTDALKTKLDSLKNTTVDTSLSATSTNPVQNKVVKSALDNKAEKVHTHDNATTSTAGFMSANDKQRLDGIRGVRYGTSAPTDMLDGELFIQVVE